MNSGPFTGFEVEFGSFETEAGDKNNKGNNYRGRSEGILVRPAEDEAFGTAELVRGQHFDVTGQHAFGITQPGGQRQRSEGTAAGLILAGPQECRTPIPTVSQWGLVISTLLLMIGAKLYFARRETATA